MTTVAELRAAGTELLIAPRPIYEPINAPEPLLNKLGRFGENYDLSTSSHLFRFLIALCGDAGAGSIKRELLYPKLQNMLESTHFSDLDRLYGDPIALPRLSAEIYAIDPKTVAMTQAEWQDVLIKDSQYRARCLAWMRAILEGSTPRGIALAAEAACGFECTVIERYQYLENLSSDLPVTMIGLGQTNSLQEFVIAVRTSTDLLTEADRRRIMRLVDRLRPLNTIFSIFTLEDVRSIQTTANVAASSEYFSIQRLVTGRPDVDWPDVDLSQGYWIEGGIEKEAPEFAFFNRQETATFITVANAIASSEHVGMFNAAQASLFGHLRGDNPTHIFDENFSYAKAFAPIQLTSPWTRTTDSSVTLVNTYYPLGYFAENTISQLTADDPQNFWASNEELAPLTETLTLDLSVDRPINFLDFEICQKPIDFIIEFSLDGVTWAEFDNDDQFEPVASVHYLPSIESSWYYTEHHFNLTTARYIRITFIRRTDAFPLDSSEPFPWSIDVRNLRVAHLITRADEFVTDTGSDILGNSYRTDITELPATNAIDGDETTFWQSQPNPVPDAVEAIYFDLRVDATPGTMAYLESAQFVGGYDNRGMADMESYVQNGVLIDEIFLNPITFGPNVHVYYSNDTDPDWDDKLWTPVPRSYVLKKGYLALPSPIYTRFIKLEFTNLVAAPYYSLDYPVPPEFTYRRFPTWVQTHFDTVFGTAIVESNAFDNPFDRVTIDPLTFGFTIPEDRLHTSYDDIRPAKPEETEDEVKTFIANIVAGGTTSPNNNSQAQESQIDFFGSTMWQQDLLAQLDDSRAYSRYVAQSLNEAGLITIENAPPTTPPPAVQSVSDLTEIRQLKERPVMYFPRTCRHQYQVVRGSRPTKIAYFVALRDVAFYRRNYAVQFDEPFYYETLDDASHLIVNDFTRTDWKFVVTP